MDAHIWKQKFFGEALLMVVAARVSLTKNLQFWETLQPPNAWLTIVANWKREAVSKSFLAFSWFENIHSSFVSVFSY